MKGITGESAHSGAAHRALGLFITRVVQHFPEGERLITSSRLHRKGLPGTRIEQDGSASRARSFARMGHWLWAPDRLAWWIAVLFLIGSALFAAFSFASDWPHLLPSVMTSTAMIGGGFFIGSVFFTAAAAMQLLEAINGDVAELLDANGIHRKRWRWFAWKPHSAGYLASLTQFVGTLMFNVNTGSAMLADLSWLREEILIWTPDFIGSVLFLASSQIAVIEVSHALWSFRPREISWWIVVVNLLGSIAFMLAALFTFYSPVSGDPEWAWGANLFTLLGAIGFFAGAGLMIPELGGVGVPPDPGVPRPSAD